MKILLFVNTVVYEVLAILMKPLTRIVLDQKTTLYDHETTNVTYRVEHKSCLHLKRTATRHIEFLIDVSLTSNIHTHIYQLKCKRVSMRGYDLRLDLFRFLKSSSLRSKHQIVIRACLRNSPIRSLPLLLGR